MTEKDTDTEAIEKKVSELNFEERQKIIFLHLIKREKNEATELLVEIIEEENTIYTIRNDEKTEIFIYVEGIYVPQGLCRIKEICRRYLLDAFNTSIFNNVISKIEADTYIDAEEFFNINTVEEIAVENGILNIFTKELTQFTEQKIFFNKLPTRYDPTKECPRIITFFLDVLKNKEDVIVMQELFGFLLLKEYKIETAFMLSGSGRNGKGKTIELIKRFLGQENCTNRTITDIENDIFARGDLLNKLANICGDLGSESITKSGWFKALTGRDLISAPRKFKSTINFVNYAKMIFSANELPRVYDNSLGFWERWVYFEFPYVFKTKKEIKTLPYEEQKMCKEIDPEIIDKISTPEEMSGLLNWALEGLERLLKNKDFSDSQTGNQIKEMWQRKANSLKAFIMDCVEENYDSIIQKKEFQKAYSNYCRKNRIKIVSDKWIKHTLMVDCGAYEERKSINGVQKNCWVGITLKGQTEGKIEENMGGKSLKTADTVSDILDNNTSFDNKSSNLKNYRISKGSKDSKEIPSRVEGPPSPLRVKPPTILATLTKSEKIDKINELDKGDGVCLGDLINAGIEIESIDKLKASGLIYEVRPGWWKAL